LKLAVQEREARKEINSFNTAGRYGHAPKEKQ
jgi:hypothetical protein